MTAKTELYDYLSARTGIELSRGGVAKTLDRFVARRQAELGLSSLAEYVHVVRGPSCAEFERLLNVVTVVYTWFFRDAGQLAAVDALLRAGPPARPIHVWVPGCATGEDAYSIALLAAHLGQEVEVLGTDVNSEALNHARVGRYTGWSVRDVREPFLAHFRKGPGSLLSVGEHVKRNVRFERHNLVDPPPAPSAGDGWDIILCRNVLIYFVRDKARRVFQRLAHALGADGHLLLGASEVVFDMPNELQATYVAERLAFRKAVTTSDATAPSVRERPCTLIPAAKARHWVGPLPALPRVAAQIAGPERAPAEHEVCARTALLQGHALLDQGDVAAARDAYVRAADADGTWADARMYAGIAHYLCGDVERAMHDLRAALFLDSGLWPAAFYLALCHESMGLPEEALRDYRHVIRLSETRPERAEHPILTAWHKDLLALAERRVAQGVPLASGS